MMSTVVISKSSSPIVVSRPTSSEPSSTMSDGTTIKLSPLDRGNFPISVLLLYEHPIINNNSNNTNTIRTALSRALLHYYPFSGRFIPGAGSGSTGPYIDCTGDGTVEFTAASADCSLKQASKLFERRSLSSTGTSSLLDELVGHYPADSVYNSTDPLLSVQLTEFTCGGFVLGVTWSHAVADGIGIAQFLGAVGELARGGLTTSPSVPPVRWDEVVSRLPPPPGLLGDVIAASLAAHGHSYQKMLQACPLVALDVTIPSSFMSRVKFGDNGEFHGQPPRCTTYEVAAAVLWRCRTRATMSESSSSPDTLCTLLFTANVRKHVGARDGYYGNCVVTQLVTATSGTVAGADIIDLVKMIRQAKDEVPGLLDEKRNENESSSKKRMCGLDERYNVLMVTSWRNIGFEVVDFGSGPPARVTWHEPGIPPFPICLMCPGKKGEEEDGVSVVSFCVKQEHADAFLKEIVKFTG